MPKLPRPERRQDRIFLIMADGSEIELEALEASLQLKAWADAVAGLSVYQATSVIPALEDIKENRLKL